MGARDFLQAGSYRLARRGVVHAECRDGVWQVSRTGPEGTQLAWMTRDVIREIFGAEPEELSEARWICRWEWNR